MASIEQIIAQPEEVEPETLQRLFPEMDTLDRQRILALRILKHTRAAYEDFTVFENVCHAINEIQPSIDHSEGCSPHHVWYLLEVINRMFEELPELADEVLTYIKFIHEDNGLQFYPSIIQDENNRLEEVKRIAEEGPFPLGEAPLDIQAARYLKIQEYLKNKRNE